MSCVSTALTDLGSGNRRSHIPAPVQPTNTPNLPPKAGWKALSCRLRLHQLEHTQHGVAARARGSVG